ncbi:MAG: GDSL family lipase [Candidatus Latescibacteria bacterium]|nr:GDSL family lipase [Candidatus Latescibacterota bacterium]
MQHILVYADSLSWGIIPQTRQRLPFEARWPGVLEIALNAEPRHSVKPDSAGQGGPPYGIQEAAPPYGTGLSVRIIEDCLNGRRTVWDDPFKPGRNGLVGLAQRIEIHSPLALVIIMLGTNDFQSMHPHNAWHAAQGMATLVEAVRQAPIEPGMPIPPVLIAAPPPIGTPQGPIAAKFTGGAEKCTGLAAAYRDVAQSLDCPFFDTGQITSSSPVDGVHLDADQHLALGKALATVVEPLLAVEK